MTRTRRVESPKERSDQYTGHVIVGKVLVQFHCETFAPVDPSQSQRAISRE